MKRVLIFGATSAIAKRTAQCFVEHGAALFLVARDRTALAALAEALRQGGARVETAVMDALDWDRHQAMITEAADRLGGLDVVLVAHGTLPDQRACDASFAETRRALDVNLLSVLSIVLAAANHFEARGAGTIAVLSSVAGDRGRRSNYIYGAAKGALNLALQGLRNRLHGAGVKVVTIKLGRVDTPMTASFEKGRTWAKPEDVGPSICRAIERGKDVVYVPAYWRVVMLILRSLPEAWFKRLRL